MRSNVVLYPFLSFSFWVDLHSIRCISSAIPYSKIEEEEEGGRKKEREQSGVELGTRCIDATPT